MAIKEHLTGKIIKYAKVRVDKDLHTNELRPSLLCEYGDHEFLDRILSRVGTIKFTVDEGYPSYWITLKNQNEFIQIDQRDQFGFIHKTSQGVGQVQMGDSILVFVETHFQVLHFFVIEGVFHNTSVLFEEFRDNQLNEAIALFLGKDQDVICKIQHAVLDEKESERVEEFKLFNHYLKLAPIASGPNLYINGLDSEGDGFMGRFYGSESCGFSYRKEHSHSRDYTLLLSNQSTTCEFAMKGVYGVLSAIEPKGDYHGTVLVYHSLAENTFEFFSTRDLTNDSSQNLLNQFEKGNLSMEVDRIMQKEGSKRFDSWNDQYFQLLKKARKSSSGDR
jgi:hypothetical protein